MDIKLYKCGKKKEEEEEDGGVCEWDEREKTRETDRIEWRVLRGRSRM